MELLRSLGFAPRRVEHGAAERPRPGEAPRDLAVRLAREKGEAALARHPPDSPALVVAADTVVALEGRILGKPEDDSDARRMLERLSDATHEVVTGLWLHRTDRGKGTVRADLARVRFARLAPSLIEAYVATGEGRDKAGSYAIQGRGALFVERLEGSWSNVVGLPLRILMEAAVDLGFAPEALLRGRLEDQAPASSR